MNDWDRDNLNFFMSLDPTEVAAWLDQASLQDLMYLTKLLRSAKIDLLMYEQDLVDCELQEMSSFDDAQKVLLKIKEKK